MEDNTILIIEDDETNRSLIRRVLELGKCRVLEASRSKYTYCSLLKFLTQFAY